MIKKRTAKNLRQKRDLSSEEEEESGIQPTLQSKKKKSVISAKSASVKQSQEGNALAVKYTTSGLATSIVQDSATRTLDVDGVEDDKETKEFVNEEGVYKGLDGYDEYVNKKTTKVTQSSASRIRAGPLKGVTNVRISCRFDYAPDICKDYKETGYCGYGDSCKFMHDRGDYKSGWEIDREWDAKQKQLAAGLPEESDEKWLVRSDQEEKSNASDSDDDGLPFACFICRQDFKDPVVTKCGHYFCEGCALQHNSKSPKCFTCAAPTMGIFQVAKELIQKLQERKRRLAEKERQIREAVGGFEDELSNDEQD